MKKKKMQPKQDGQVFKRTAVRAKKVNLGVKYMRGGIRF